MRENSQRIALVGVAFFIGCVVRYFLGNDSAEIKRLQTEITNLRSEDARLPALAVAKLRMRSARDSHVRPPATDPSNPGVPQPLSPEWQLQMEADYKRQLLDGWNERTAKERIAEYTRVFSEFGIDSEKIGEFKSRLKELHTKAIAAGEPLMELIRARNAYDREMRSSLGEENYARYREYEESKPSVREYQMLAEFSLNEKKITLDSTYAEPIVQLIRDSGATTTERWDGPYDPLPRPASGREMVINALNQRLDALKEASSRLLQGARDAGIPDGYIQLIEAYYGKKLIEKQQEISSLARPDEEIRQEIEQIIEAKIRKHEEESKRQNSARRP